MIVVDFVESFTGFIDKFDVDEGKSSFANDNGPTELIIGEFTMIRGGGDTELPLFCRALVDKFVTC